MCPNACSFRCHASSFTRNACRPARQLRGNLLRSQAAEEVTARQRSNRAEELDQLRSSRKQYSKLRTPRLRVPLHAMHSGICVDQRVTKHKPSAEGRVCGASTANAIRPKSAILNIESLAAAEICRRLPAFVSRPAAENLPTLFKVASIDIAVVGHPPDPRAAGMRLTLAAQCSRGQFVPRATYQFHDCAFIKITRVQYPGTRKFPEIPLKSIGTVTSPPPISKPYRK
jgi:hypothetical protein